MKHFGAMEGGKSAQVLMNINTMAFVALFLAWG
jgi:hypothetical protein